ncbi:MAG: DUF72 domain-containing protein [Flavobacteriales bacterium]|nr:DUF72 domain-containing protein [Flavobacteriales bacterium]
MKFGKLEDISNVDFSLPEDHPFTQEVLASAKWEGGLKVFTGGTMWTIKDWKGKWYPAKTPQKDFARAYFNQFGTIELNATHYRIHPPATIRGWKEMSPPDFVFCPKFPNLISHYRQFLNCESLTDEFLTAIAAFDDQLGPSFIQLPPRMASSQAPKIRAYLKSLPRDIPIHIEFRHESWFDGNEEAEKTWELMRELAIGSVITDTAGRRDAVHMRLTSPILILRFGGCQLDPTDYTRMHDWAIRIHKWQQQGLRQVYIWMHQPESILTPETLIAFGKEIENTTGVTIKSPQLITP